MKLSLMAVLIALAGLARADDAVKLNLTSPQDYQVFQRQAETGGKIVIECSLETTARGVLTNLDGLEARVSGETFTNDWNALPFDNRVRQFRNELSALAGGWYRVEVRLNGGGKVVSEAVAEHVGVGEVFVIAGQSNSANHGEEKQRPKSPLVVAFGNGRWQPAGDPEPGASGKGGSFMPAFGDAMVNRFKVPVGLVPIGVGSTSVREWLPQGTAVVAPPDTGRNVICTGSNTWMCTGELFDHITEVEKQFGAQGFRAVLWHQGESDSHEAADRAITPAQYRQYLERVIEASRAAAGWRVPWFVAQASYHRPEDMGSSELRAAQKSLVTDGIALAGPNTDELGPEFRQDGGKGVHFNARGLQRHGELWAECVGPWLEGQRVVAAAGKMIDVTKAGVVGDGTTLNTVSIQKAIDDCSAGGGGTVSFPAGRYLTGTIQIKSGVTLRLEDQATLLGSTNVADYRNLDPFIDGSGNPLGHALIVAVDADHVGIEGGGTVDGQGSKLKARQKTYTMRPFLLRWVRCTDVMVKDVHLTNPGAWTLNFFQTRGAVIEGVTIRTRGLGLHNNDGVNIDSSENIRVQNCDVNSGDDALVIKATSAKPSRHITATKCKLSTRTNAIKLGTESFGSFEDIAISDCEVTNTQMAGIALYAVDGGDLRHVTISNITMDGVVVPISIRLGARLKTFREGDQPKPVPGKLSDVSIKNVTAKNVGMIGLLINGVPGHPVESLALENIHMEVPGGGTAEDALVKLPEKEAAYPEFEMFGKTMPAYGIYARHVQGITFQNVQMTLVKPDARPATVLVDVSGVTPANFAAEATGGK